MRGCGLKPGHGGVRERRTAGQVVATCFVLLFGSALASAQAPVDMRANFAGAQSGRMLDANPMVGGGGYNAPQTGISLMGGNLYASGLAGRGMSLRLPSAISAPTAFRAPVGSGALYSFRRDSISPLSAPLGVGTYSQPYFDTSTTVPTAGLLQGGFVSGAGLIGGSRDRADVRSRVPGLSEAPLVGVQPPYGAAPSAGISYPYGARGPLSGMGAQAPFPPPPQPTWDGEAVPPDRAAELARLTGRDTVGLGYGLSTLDALSQPVGTLLRPSLYGDADAMAAGAPLPGVIWDDGFDPAAVPPDGTVPGVLSGAGLAGLVPAAPQIDPRIVPGFEVFNDLRMAAALIQDPNAAWYDEIQDAVREDPVLQEVAGEAAELQGPDFAAEMMTRPLRTMTGRGTSDLNNELLRAEASMELGRYVEAAERYAAAAAIDPVNPLPLLGQGHAYLAQGQYWSAATMILRGIDLAERYPGGVAGLLMSRLDLEALMGGGEIVDTRRAALMRSLDTREDPELRFLLGYLEYHSGDRARGLENLRRAAEHPRASAVIARYPALLERGTAPPSPRPVAPPPPDIPVDAPADAAEAGANHAD